MTNNTDYTGRGFSRQYAVTDSHGTVIFYGDHADATEYATTYTDDYEHGLFVRRMMAWELSLLEEAS